MSNVRGSRFLAAIIDMIVVSVGSSSITKIFTNLISDNTVSLIVSLVISLVITIVYFTVIPYLMKGATVGKMALKLRAVSEDGSDANIVQLIFRNYNLLVSFITIPLSVYFFDLSNKLAPFKDDQEALMEALKNQLANEVRMVMILGFFVLIAWAGIFISVMTSHNGESSVHDKIAKTKVVRKDS